MNDEIKKQFNFITEVDKLKNIFRQSLITDGSRHENDAEHSWHVSLMCMLLSKYAPDGTDILRCIKMLIIHDLVEIYAGDTYLYDSDGMQDKFERELSAADKLFALLPSEQAEEYKQLWLEFEKGSSNEKKFAALMDRLQPIILNYTTKGKMWLEHGVTDNMVRKMAARATEFAAPELKELFNDIIEKSVENGYLNRNVYSVKKLKANEINVTVPGSKSITNRALLLAALSTGEFRLENVLFSGDSRAFMSCIEALGFELKIDESSKTVDIKGGGGSIPNRSAVINVESAGTAARFLTAMLAFAGGSYTLHSSAQMEKRPMKPLLDALESAGGVKIKYLKNEGCFPFELNSNGIECASFEIDTNVSSQFTSALLISSALLADAVEIKLSGSRISGAYIRLTVAMMKQFGLNVEFAGNKYIIKGRQRIGINEYEIEPDVSAACYFYAMAPLLDRSVFVKGVHKSSIQGDIEFIKVLERLGCRAEDGKEGIRLSGVDGFDGAEIDMGDFSDQTMTMAAIAPFARSPVTIKNIGHIRYQETDRISAVATELTRMGVECEQSEASLRIAPAQSIKPCSIKTYNDHRMAMAFTLVGLRAEGITIENPECCAKTFENYFNIIDSLC